MSEVALRMEHVYKMFRKGEVFNSLRDLIPALTGRMFRQQELSASDKREFWALQDISFELKRGEAFGVIGPNGAGKSTMLKLLSRVMKPTSGSIYVKGRVSALIELAAGFHQDFTGRENIYLYGTILGMTRREIDAKFEEIIEFSGLADFIDTPVKKYSSGMYARLGFSVAAHVNPDILLVDEVLSVGDYAFQRRCVERMKGIIQSGATVLFVSHNLKTVSEFCHRSLLLERGRMVMIGPVEEAVAVCLDRSHRVHVEEDAGSKPVIISKVKVRNEYGECARFRSGQKAWIDVELRARTSCSKLSLTLYITNDELRNVFDTSTERLGLGNFTLDEGEVYTCTFELYLDLVGGIFHPSILVYRYDTQTAYDCWQPATTIYVSYDEDVRGTVNCFPRVIRREIRPGSEASLASVAWDAKGGTACDPD
jgi:ABC-type polysaccharide/polyol phosphate transport system ATPase subunit